MAIIQRLLQVNSVMSGELSLSENIQNYLYILFMMFYVVLIRVGGVGWTVAFSSINPALCLMLNKVVHFVQPDNAFL
ncbi:MAG: hypothetical protein H7839_21780 [Magnetococcus sp. YQC-5]